MAINALLWSEGFPEIIVGNRCRHADILFRHRVDESDIAGKQADAAIGVAAFGPVFQVALDRTTDSGELHPDLMLSACEKFHLDEVIVVGLRDDAVFQHSFLCAWFLDGGGIRFVVAFGGGDVVHQRVLVFWWPVLGYGPICLVDIAIAEHLVHSCQCLAGLGKHHEAEYWAVETVHHATEHVARFGIFLLNPLFYGFRQWRVAGFVALNDFA